MICFERADALHAHEKALRAIQVTDADTLCAYLKGFWEFIYNHKMFGCVYDIYSDDIELYRENGFVQHLRRTHRPETGGRKGHQSQRFPCAENRRRVADCSGANYAPL